MEEANGIISFEITLLNVYRKHTVQLTEKVVSGLRFSHERVLSCLSEYNETHIIPCSVEILGGEVLSDQVTFDFPFAPFCCAFSTGTPTKDVPIVMPMEQSLSVPRSSAYLPSHTPESYEFYLALLKGNTLDI